jgi:hypothetical protein
MNAPCNICCHETRNALAAVVHLAKHVRADNLTMASTLLDAAIKRLEKNLDRCATDVQLDDFVDFEEED